MKKSLLATLALCATCALTMFAADAAGTWKSSVDTPNGTFESTYVLKADGAKLTGTVSSRMGESEVSDGKIDGDNVSFSVVRNFNGSEFKIVYKGKVSGDEMKLTIEIPGRGDTFEVTAKRVTQ